ncbi:MAG: YfhO family protein [Chloroflexota bacterium]|nr:YfhO family protein [Chloroflexota bacterium]
MIASAPPPPTAHLPQSHVRLIVEARRAPRGARLLREVAPYLVLVLCCVVLFRDGLFGDAVFYQRDTVLFYQPLGRWVADQLKAGHLPLWMPLIFGGYPIFADGELGMLYPPNLILLTLVPAQLVLTAGRALHLFLAGAFMLAFLRVLGVGRWGALVGGLVFAFGSFFIAQLQHENLVRSAVWLPLILLLVERALRAGGWARQRRLVLAGLTLAVAALGLHVQPIAMTLLALGLYTTYRLVVGPIPGPAWERWLLLAWAPTVVAGIGLAVAAVQWLPLYELGQMSHRGPGLTYELAATYPLRWQNLATVVFPYLFRMENGLWVTLWERWETFLYVGMAPLGLGLLGLLLTRRRIVAFFVLLGLFGLAVGLADQSPLNVHRLLWSLPGLSSLRAPGRFAYLVVFASAGLAAFGVDWLACLRRPSRLGIAAGGAVLAGAAGLAGLAHVLRMRLLADPVRWKGLIDEYYLSTPHEFGWLDAAMVYDRLVAGLDLAEPRTALSLALLAAGGLLIAAWSRWPGRAATWAVALTLLVAGDLLLFARAFHPRAPLAELVRPVPMAEFLARSDPRRALADSAIVSLEPNRLLHADVPAAAGYSSLQPQRHYEYWSSVDRAHNDLLDLWGVDRVVVEDPPSDVATVDGVVYRPLHPLFSGAAYNRTGLARFAIEPFLTVEVRVLATLSHSVFLEDGDAAAEVDLIGRDGARRTITLRAGDDLAENAYERPDVAALVRHARAPVAATIPDLDPAGRPTRGNLYRAAVRIDPVDVVGVEIRHLLPRGQTRVYGLGLVDAAGSVRSLHSADRAKFRPIHRDGRLVVLQNLEAFPRAYVVPDAVAHRPGAEGSALSRLTLGPFDAARQVLLEDGPFDEIPLVEPRREPIGDPGALPLAAEVIADSGDQLRIRTPDGPGGYLVLTDTYHRGWRARVDGAEAPVYLANSLFRAVHLPPGSHTVEFVFDPLSLRIGRAVSLATLAFCLLVLATSIRSVRPRRRPLS